METAELILSGKEKADELIILSGAAERSRRQTIQLKKQ